MNNFSLRLKKNNDKKAITPVIATIILIAVTLVLALVVGAYTFGLFGSNVKTVTLTSASLYASGTGGNASFQFALNNPGSNTNITSVVLTSGGGTQYTITASTIKVGGNTTTGIDGGAVSSVVAPLTSALTSGQTYGYVITFKNGQSITGSQIAQ